MNRPGITGRILIERRAGTAGGAAGDDHFVGIFKDWPMAQVGWRGVVEDSIGKTIEAGLLKIQEVGTLFC